MDARRRPTARRERRVLTQRNAATQRALASQGSRRAGRPLWGEGRQSARTCTSSSICLMSVLRMAG